MPRTIAIIQARMGSSRLPGKVLLDLAGQPVLARVVERTRRAKLLDGLVVAIPEGNQDDPLAEFCEKHDYPVVRGSLNDVLDRFYQAARQRAAEAVVRITGDCPVVDPELIDATIGVLGEYQADFATNRLPPPWQRTYPIGLDVEACTMQALERAWREAGEKYQREHVMPYIYEGVQLDQSPVTSGMSRHGFKIVQLNHTPDHGRLRWTVDTEQDLELLRRIYSHFEGRDDFSWQAILDLVEHEKNLSDINAQVKHKSVYDTDARVPDGSIQPNESKGEK